MKSGRSKHYPQNTKIFIPSIKTFAEIYWQTQNANHILENYVDRISQYNVQHDLKFNDIVKLLQNDVVFFEDRSSYGAVSYVAEKKRYYFVLLTLQKRFDQYFAIIITAYATKKSHHIKKFREIQKSSG